MRASYQQAGAATPTVVVYEEAELREAGIEMKKITTAVALTVVCSLAACGESDSTGPDGPPSPVGTWDLLSVNGQTPPISRCTFPDCDPLSTIHRRVLEFRIDGSVTSTLDATDPLTGVRTTTTATGSWAREETGPLDSLGGRSSTLVHMQLAEVGG